jgi:hypothetical protein
LKLGAALTDLDEEGEKLADITLVTPQDDPHGQQVLLQQVIIWSGISRTVSSNQPCYLFTFPHFSMTIMSPTRLTTSLFPATLPGLITIRFTRSNVAPCPNFSMAKTVQRLQR